MYLAFVLHGIRPSAFYEMGEGERRIMKVFMIKELEDRASALEGD